jgi:hypothetical protein
MPGRFVPPVATMIATQFHPPARMLVRCAVAPARWLERARGRWRILLATLYMVVAAAVGVIGWRMTRLQGLPDIAEPFDTRPLLGLRVADDRNAFTFFALAAGKAQFSDHLEKRHFNGAFTWAVPSDPELVAYMKANAEALGLWCQGCERNEALCTPLSDVTFDSKLPGLSEHRRFVRMALMEAARHEASGDMAGAWRWYRFALRGSRLVGHNATAVGMLIGAAEYSMAQARIAVWYADPRVDARLLRRALDDVLAINAMSAPYSETLKVEYLIAERGIQNPQWLISSLADNPLGVHDAVDLKAWHNYVPTYWRARWFLGNEPECSRRLAKLAFANWLAECDKLPSERARLVGVVQNTRMFYDIEPPRGAPEPAALAARVEANLHASSILPAYPGVATGYDRDRAQRASLVMSLADALYTKQFGKPPGSPEYLIGPCLKSFPEGYVRQDAD